MKIILLLLAALLLIVLILYVVLAIQSQKVPNNLGLQDGFLRPCPDSPNCVCSETHSQNNTLHHIAPIKGDKTTWEKLKTVIQAQGGNIQQQQDDYIHATFKSSLFRYVDDVELRLDSTQGLIHLRSASRTGRNDFQVNRKRIEAIKQDL